MSCNGSMPVSSESTVLTSLSYLQLAHPCNSHHRRIHLLIPRLAHHSLQICPSPGGKRQALGGADVNPQTRRPEAPLHDPSLPSAVLAIQRRHVHLSNRSSVDVCRGDCMRHAETAHPRLHWQQIGRHCGERGENAHRHQSGELDQHPRGRHHRCLHRLVHI